MEIALTHRSNKNFSSSNVFSKIQKQHNKKGFPKIILKLATILENGRPFYKSDLMFLHFGKNKLKSHFINFTRKWIVYEFPNSI